MLNKQDTIHDLNVNGPLHNPVITSQMLSDNQLHVDKSKTPRNIPLCHLLRLEIYTWIRTFKDQIRIQQYLKESYKDKTDPQQYQDLKSPITITNTIQVRTSYLWKICTKKTQINMTKMMQNSRAYRCHRRLTGPFARQSIDGPMICGRSRGGRCRSRRSRRRSWIGSAGQWSGRWS